MANKKFYTVEKEINGVNYVAQFSGLSVALKAVDDSYIEGSENVSMTKLSDYVFKHVIVQPKGLTADDFDSLKEFNDVMNWAQAVMQGQFRPADK